MTGSLNPELPGKGDLEGVSDSKIRKSLITLRDGLNAILNDENDIDRPVTWYEPKVIATAQARESTSYGTLSTADEVRGVVVPSDALLLISYAALMREGNGGGKTAHAAIFVGATQLRNLTNTGEEFFTSQSSPYKTVYTASSGLTTAGDNGSETVPTVGTIGQTACFAPAGTYNISVQYKASAGGSAVAKSRRLHVGVVKPSE